MTALTLTSVQRDFEEWRSTRPKIGKIPEQLWAKALQLLEYYPIGEVTKALHLSGGQIANRRNQRNNVRPKMATPLSSTEFVELNTSTAGITYNCSNQIDNLAGRLEIRRPDGLVLAIEQLPATAIMQILSHFTHGVQ